MYAFLGAIVGGVLGFLIGVVTRPTIFGEPLPLGLMFGDDYYQVGNANMHAVQTHMWTLIAIGLIACGVIGFMFERLTAVPATADASNSRDEELDVVPLSLRMAVMATAAKSEQPKEKPSVVGSFKFDESRWDILLASDPEISAAADEVRGIDLSYEDELAARYLASLDKSDLPKIIEEMRGRAS